MDEAQLLSGLPIGEVVRSRGRTISAGECALLTDLTWTIGPVHTDHEYAAGTMFGSVVLPAPIMIALIGGLWTQSEHGQHLVDAGFRVVSALGVQARYRHPFRFGDTVHVESQVVSGRASAGHPGRAVIVIDDRALNQHGDVLIEQSRTQLVARIEVAEAGRTHG
jgi:itaconyl-CoA hydratase